MEPVSDDGKRQTAVVQPAAKAHAEHGHIPVSTTSISCSNLRAGGRAARAAPAICQHHMPPNVCTGPLCDDIHVCRLYLDGFCPREDTDCPWGHVIRWAGNGPSLDAYRLHGVPEDDLIWLAWSLMRQTASVSHEDYHQELMLCDEYSSGAKCDRDDCFKIHLCPRLVAGHCPSGSQCGWNHQLDAQENLMILMRLKCATLTVEDVMARLARPREEMRESVSSSSGVDSQMTMSPSATEDGPELPNSGDETETEEADDEVPCDEEEKDEDLEVDEEEEDEDVEVDDEEEEDEDVEVDDEEEEDEDVEVDDEEEEDEEDEDVDDDDVDDDSSVSSAGKRDATYFKSLDICVANTYPSRCVDSGCSKLHLCRLYVAGICPYGTTCGTGHRLRHSIHNCGLIGLDLLRRRSGDDILALLREGHLVRYPILDIEREYALQTCRPYQSGSCELSDCARLHICDRHVDGFCKGEDGCGRSHDLGDPAHGELLERFGLKSASEERLLEFIKSRVTARDVRYALMRR